MANAISTIQKYVPMLDEVYAYASLSSVLDTPANLIRDVNGAGTVLYAKISTVGLTNYSRASGFTAGDETLTWEARTLRYDRGRTFSVDAMDDNETVGLAFAALASEFIRTKVVPEVDAIRFNEYATNAGTKVVGTLDASGIDAAIVAGETALQDKEVGLAGAVLFMTPAMYANVKNSAQWSRTLIPAENPNRNFGMYDEMEVIVVPSGRFAEGITLYTGSDSTQGGYAKNTQQTASFEGDGSTKTFTVSAKPASLDSVTVSGTASTAFTYEASTGVITFTAAPADDAPIVVKHSGHKDINFMIIARGAVMQIIKHGKLRVFDPDTNQSADAYKVDYRIYHDAWVLDNKKDGIYVHQKAAE